MIVFRIPWLNSHLTYLVFISFFGYLYVLNLSRTEKRNVYQKCLIDYPINSTNNTMHINREINELDNKYKVNIIYNCNLPKITNFIASL